MIESSSMAKSLLQAWTNNGSAGLRVAVTSPLFPFRPDPSGPGDAERWELLNSVAATLAAGGGSRPNSVQTRVCLELLSHLSGGESVY
jgi:hypothetical protein